jgi:hypothetical protein
MIQISLMGVSRGLGKCSISAVALVHRMEVD